MKWCAIWNYFEIFKIPGRDDINQIALAMNTKPWVDKKLKLVLNFMVSVSTIFFSFFEYAWKFPNKIFYI